MIRSSSGSSAGLERGRQQKCIISVGSLATVYVSFMRAFKSSTIFFEGVQVDIAWCRVTDELRWIASTRLCLSNVSQRPRRLNQVVKSYLAFTFPSFESDKRDDRHCEWMVMCFEKRAFMEMSVSTERSSLSPALGRIQS